MRFGIHVAAALCLIVFSAGCPRRYAAEPPRPAPGAVQTPPPPGVEVNPALPQPERPSNPSNP